jgi:hypothetical protein
VIARITRRSYQLRNPRKRRGGVRGARGHQAPDWTLSELKLLGTRPDAEIAKLTKRTVLGVTLRRRRLKIPTFGSTFRRWTKAEDQLLGKLRDEELAKKLNRPISGIRQRRRKRGLRLPDAPKPWTRKEERVLGKHSDSQTAKLLGRTHHEIYHRRIKLRISPFMPRHKPWTRAEEALLGTIPDGELAKQLQRSKHSIQTRRRSRDIPVKRAPRVSWKPQHEELTTKAYQTRKWLKRTGRSLRSVAAVDGNSGAFFEITRRRTGPRRKMRCWAPTRMEPSPRS